MPRPFSDFQEEAEAVACYLEALVLIAICFREHGCRSLTKAVEKMGEVLQDFARRQGGSRKCPKYNTIRNGLPKQLTPLLYHSFGRLVQLWQSNESGKLITGLTEDGWVAAQMAEVFLYGDCRATRPPS